MPIGFFQAIIVTGRPSLACPGLLAAVLLLQSCATAGFRSTPVVQFLPHTETPGSISSNTGNGILKVLTLNIAHGRGDGFHQLLQNSEKTLANLDTIAVLLEEQYPDVVALQEADGASYWSGKFDHVEYLARQASFTQYVRASHADGYGLSYGTAFVSRLELRDPEAITFDPALSPVPKGFVVATVAWPGRPCIEVDIASVHLDFSSEAIRRKQAAALIDILASRDRPMILMGDFNTRWEKQDSALHLIVRELGLTPYKPEEAGLGTFASSGHRLDWILISPAFNYITYDVIKENVSDHRAVIAELALSQKTYVAGSSVSCIP